MIRRSRGMFCVSSVCLPGPNKSSACPFRKKITSCDSCTINCVVVLKSSQGCFHMKVLLSPSYLMMSAIFAMTPPPSIFYCVLLQKYTFTNLGHDLFKPHFQIFLPFRRMSQPAYCRLPLLASRLFSCCAMLCVPHRNYPAKAKVVCQT